MIYYFRGQRSDILFSGTMERSTILGDRGENLLKREDKSSYLSKRHDCLLSRIVDKYSLNNVYFLEQFYYIHE